MREKVYFKNSKGDKLCCILSDPGDTKSVVIMAHGFASDKNTKSFLALEERLNKEGIATLRIDLYAHGESEGEFENISGSEATDDILQAIEYVKSKGYTAIGLIGSSFGGCAAMMAASKTSDISVLGLKSPVSSYEELWEKRPEEQKRKWKEDGYTMYEDSDKSYRLNYSYYLDFKNNHPYEVAHKISVPTIIVHGDADDVVPVEQSIKVSKLIPNCKLVVVKGATHRYKDGEEIEQLINELSNFVKSYVGR